MGSLFFQISVSEGHNTDELHSEPDAVFGSLGLDEETLADLRSGIARRLTPKPVKVRADIEVKCFSYAGIEAIKRALTAGEAVSTPEVPIKVRLVAPPLYVMSTTSTDKNAAIELMEKAVDVIGETVRKDKGDITIKMKVSFSLKILNGRLEDINGTSSTAQGCFGNRRCGAQSSHGTVRSSQHGPGG